MDDDFNTAQAIAALFDLAWEINKGADEGCFVEEAQRTLNELAGVLGLTLHEEEVHLNVGPFLEMAVAYGIGIDRGAPQASHYIDLLVEKRTEMRRAKEWALADNIRAGLAELGIILEDAPQGTTWRYRR
jgi:cysteinyl-tRNA synthetase